MVSESLSPLGRGLTRVSLLTAPCTILELWSRGFMCSNPWHPWAKRRRHASKTAVWAKAAHVHGVALLPGARADLGSRRPGILAACTGKRMEAAPGVGVIDVEGFA